MKLKVAVLFGGQNSEHPVSLMSAYSVINNLDPEKYDLYLVGITTDGRWYHFNGSVELLNNDNWLTSPSNEEVILSPNANHHGFYNLKKQAVDYVDLVFPVLHGRNGEDGTITSVCQLAGIPCVSCDMVSCAIAIDKEFTHIVAESYGVKMARYRALKKKDFSDYQSTYESLISDLGLPFYVKPSREGSSFGAHKVSNYDEFVEYIDDAFHYDDKILAEEFISGTEVGCAFLGRNSTGVVYEVVVDTEMYGYEEKYDGYKTNLYFPAKNLSQQQMDEVIRIGKIVYDALGCDVLARVDFFAGKELIFNELNLIPGFTSHSLYPGCFIASGVSYPQLLDRLINVTLGANNE